MAKRRATNLQFPLAGLDRRYAYQRQPPYTTPDALNVRPDGTIEGRARGGSRPGFGLAGISALGGGNPIRMMANLRYDTNRDNWRVWEDDFAGNAMGDTWITQTWAGGLPTVFKNGGVGAAYNTERDAFCDYDAFEDLIDKAAAVTVVELMILPHRGYFGGRYRLFMHLNKGEVEYEQPGTRGLMATADISPAGVVTGQLQARLNEYSQDFNFTERTLVGSAPILLSVWIQWSSPYYTVAVVIGSQVLLGNTQIYGETLAKGVGFYVQCTDETSEYCLVDSFRIRAGQTGTGPMRRDSLLLSTNGSLYYQNMYGGFSEAGGGLTLPADRDFRATDHSQKLFIADSRGVLASGTEGLLTITGGFTDLSVSDWSALGIAAGTDHCVIPSTNPSVNGRYTITVVDPSYLVLDPVPDGNYASLDYYIIADGYGPKIFYPATYAMVLWEGSVTSGALPAGCHLIARYRGRIVLASPNHWYMSRQHDPYDWDYPAAEDDAQRAILGSLAEVGAIGDEIRALIPHSDDYLVMGCAHSLWVVRGDPAAGGIIDNLSRSVGILGAQAWCSAPTGELVFLTHDGLYRLGAGAASYPEPLSRSRLPNELREILGRWSSDFAVAGVTPAVLGFDRRENGVCIHLNPEDISLRRDWWFDWDTGGFWPVELPSAIRPTAIIDRISETASECGLWFGCRDGLLRRFYPSATKDEADIYGVEFDDYVLYGPFRLSGDDDLEGVLTDLYAAIATDSGDVTWTVYVGDCPESAYARYEAGSAFATGTWNAGLNYRSRPRARAGSAFLKLASKSGESFHWAVERVGVKFTRAGQLRKR